MRSFAQAVLGPASREGLTLLAGFFLSSGLRCRFLRWMDASSYFRAWTACWLTPLQLLQNAPDVGWMVPDAALAFAQVRHPRGGPQAGGVSQRLRPGLEPLVGGAQAEAATRPAFIESSPHYFCHAEIASKPKWNCSLNAANEFNFSYQRGKFIFRRSWSPDVLNLINKQRTPGNRTLPPFKAIKRRSCGVGGEEVRRGIGSA